MLEKLRIINGELKINLTWLVSLCSVVIVAQNNNEYVKYVDSVDLRKHLSVLASDEYEGRETGERGQKKAAEYIANHFKSIGLLPGANNNSYFQPFELDVQNKKDIEIKINKTKYTNNKDFISFYGLNENSFAFKEIIFKGFGIKDETYNDYQQSNIEGKAVLIIDGEPQLNDSTYLTTGTKQKTDWSTNYRKKEELARNAGAKILFIAVNDIDKAYTEYKHRIFAKSMKLKADSGTVKKEKIPVVFISKTMANDLLSKNKITVDKLQAEIVSKKQSINASAKTKLAVKIKVIQQKISSENVLGFLEGTTNKDELIVITAHYDHLGVEAGLVFNGADDDGSGTVAVMELAQAFAKAKEQGFAPKRSILFMTVAGEEKGLLGSEYYSEHPVYPLKNTVANLNIDMIGRIDAAHKDSANYIYIIGSDKLSNDLHNINEEVNKKYVGLKLDYRFNSTKDPNRYYYRSDHYNFARKGVPVIFYFNGTHPDYHKETDEIEKINFPLMETRARLVFQTAWELVNRTERIRLNK